MITDAGTTKKEDLLSLLTKYQIKLTNTLIKTLINSHSVLEHSKAWISDNSKEMGIEYHITPDAEKKLTAIIRNTTPAILKTLSYGWQPRRPVARLLAEMLYPFAVLIMRQHAAKRKWRYNTLRTTPFLHGERLILRTSAIVTDDEYVLNKIRQEFEKLGLELVEEDNRIKKVINKLKEFSFIDEKLHNLYPKKLKTGIERIVRHIAFKKPLKVYKGKCKHCGEPYPMLIEMKGEGTCTASHRTQYCIYKPKQER